ncbi:hypothetical protein TrRE_jg13517, partial [Triparma retinervis]
FRQPDEKGFLKATLRYFKDEWEAKRKPGKFPEKEWTLMETPDDYPQQRNGFDCGVFTCAGADFISAGKKPEFTTEDAAKMRKIITFEILKRQEEEAAGPPALTPTTTTITPVTKAPLAKDPSQTKEPTPIKKTTGRKKKQEEEKTAAAPLAKDPSPTKEPTNIKETTGRKKKQEEEKTAAAVKVGVKAVVSTGFLPSYQHNIEPAGNLLTTTIEITKLVISDGRGGSVEGRFTKPEEGEVFEHRNEATKVHIQIVVFKGEEEEGKEEKWTGFW